MTALFKFYRLIMDYAQEAINSLLWIVKTLAMTAVVFSFGIFLLVRLPIGGNNFGNSRVGIFHRAEVLNLCYFSY